MNQTLLFDSPLLLGFDHTRALLERASKTTSDVYPPFNIEDRGDRRIRLTLAVAGFGPESLSVTVEDNQLVVVGKRDSEPGCGPERAFLHRGIAARGFLRGFVLADGLDVEGAVLENGLLCIDVVRPPPAKRSRLVPIRTTG
jgi:HSP20 family molecular chaperone IbpA